MFPGHPRHFDGRLLGAFRDDIDNHILKEVEVVNSGEGFVLGLGIGKVRFGVRGGYDREVAAQGFFDFLVEVVAVGFVREKGNGCEEMGVW